MTETKKADFSIEFDNVENPDTMTITIPLGLIANENVFIFMLGFFENAKDQASAIVRAKRRQREQLDSGVILPSGGSSLKVH